MKVAILTYDLPDDEHPATGRFILRHVHALAGQYDVRVVQARVQLSPRWSIRTGARDLGGTEVQSVVVSGPPGPAHVKAAALVTSCIGGADVLHTMAFESLLLGRLAQASRPWVHTEHSSNATDVPAGLAGAYVRGLRPLLRRPALVTAVSGYLRDGIRRLGRDGPTEVVPNVVEVPDLPRPAAASATVRIVSVGALVTSKRPLLALSTTAALRARGVDARLLWIGEGPLANAFSAETQRLGLAAAVQRQPFCAPEAYLMLLSEADVFLLPTEFETFCVSAAEAIGLGVPAVVGDRGGQRDFIDDRNGLLVTGSSATGYADAVMTVLGRDRPFPDQQAVTKLRNRLSTEAVGDQFRRAYEAADIGPRQRIL